MIAASMDADGRPRHPLRSELYRSCLPQTAEDTGRRVVWMNTVCTLFLAGGLLGIAHPPGLVLRKLAVEPVLQPVEVKVLKTDPEDRPPPAKDEVMSEEPTPVEEVSVPPVIVAPPDANVPFPVVPPGPVILSKDPNFAAPPPREARRGAPSAPQAPSGPRRFERGGSGTGEGRITPDAQYPKDALRDRLTGSGEFLVTIDATGRITETKLLSSSGHFILDNAFRQHVRSRWRFLPEDAGQLIIPFEYRLR
jgi:TonB family protein